MDFFSPCVKINNKNGNADIYPKFKVGSSKDLMIRGGDFYAIWDEENKKWATDQDTAIRLIDKELDECKKKYIEVHGPGCVVNVKYMHDSESGIIDKWHHYCQKQMRDHWVSLDGKLIFSNTDVKREDYSSHKLSYPLQEGPYESYDKLMSVLYSDEERMKIEWAIGSIVAGDSDKIQKFIVFTGDAGTGKSTVLKILRMLFDGYTATIDAKAIASPQASFALESLKNNPLVAIQDEADLSSIKDNTRLNSLISHEYMSVNEKFKSPYEHAYRCFMFLAANEDVQITDSRSGIQRRLIDVRPTGKLLEGSHYFELMDKIQFELSGIAYHCLSVYKENKHKYDKYRPTQTMRNTNYFYNYVEENYEKLKDGTTLDLAWGLYLKYCDDNQLVYRMNRVQFKKELAAYYKKFIADTHDQDRRHLRNIYAEFRPEKLGLEPVIVESKESNEWITFTETESLFDKLYSDQPAQYANEEGGPKNKWEKVKTKLRDLDTSKLHWLKLPEDVIKIDFDKKDENGNKSLELNLKAANKFPKTYAEISKSGCGIHLYYIYDGNPSELSRIFDEDIEIKISTGNNSHRRILTKCNELPIAHISTGLPLKEVKKRETDVPITISGLKTTIKRCLAKEIHGDTRSNIDWIYEILERAYASELRYDLTDMKAAVEDFAAHSTNQSEYCKKKVTEMKFKSKEKGEQLAIEEKVLEDERQVRDLINYYIYDWPGDGYETIEKIKETLAKAYHSGLTYDVSDMRQTIMIYSIDNAQSALDLLEDMHFSSEREGDYGGLYDPDDPLIFFDIEVKPNMNLLCWKYEDEEGKPPKPVFEMFNPTSQQIEEFLGLHKKYKPKLIGYNNKEYDNHILYAMWLGKSPYEVFLISSTIVGKDKQLSKQAKYREAKKLSFSDVLDYMPEKIGLKKWEIRLNIPHKEFAQAWDEPIPEEYWPQLAEYCKNDVRATEAVHKSKAGQAAWKARLILVDLANILMGPGSVPNDSTNDLTTKLIVGNEKNPQQYFVYPDLSEEFPGYEYDAHGIDPERYISKDVIISGKSIYRGYDPGEGGFVWAKHGMYGFAESDDSASHHPSTIKAKNGFGVFTPNFTRLLDLRLMIKHKEYDKLRSMYNGALAKYLETDEDAKALSFALKIAINSVYGLTAANFPNRLRDPRNKDNWVAKRGALFMIDLLLNVQKMGYTVIHCKTDSIKILNPDDKVRNYICEYGKKFGYTFEVEHRFDRICLVNDAVYVCKYTDEDVNEDERGKWSATGKQFQVPYVFKTLFTHEPIQFEDLCETKNSSTALYLDMNEDLPEGEHNYEFIGKTGQFCPIKPGCGGGVLLRDAGNDKFAAPDSTKGYRWLESEIVKARHMEEDIDRSYYIKFVDKAIETISKFGDFEAFTAEGNYVDMSFMNVPETENEEFPWN